MTKHYVYKGYGITNENGVAHLDHDANGDPINHSYTGVGAGEIDFVASLDDLSDVTIDVNPSTINDTTAGVSHSISATVMDDGSAVQNKSVVFELYKVSDGSLVETLTGVTNSFGEVSVSYVGKDTGSLNIQCRLLQETYDVWDTLFFDNCTDNTKSSMWYVYNNTVSTPVFDESGVFIERTSTGNGFLFVGQSNGTDKPFSLDFAVEFDVVETTGDVRFIPDSGNWERINNMSANDHYKVEFYTDHQIITKNNGAPVSYEKTHSGSFKVQVMFAGISSIKLKNVKVYSI